MNLVGVYMAQSEILRNGWEPVEFMKEQIGLNLIILELGIQNFEEVFNSIGKGVPPEEIVSKTHFNKNDLVKVLGEAHKRNIRVWICAGTFAEMNSKEPSSDLAFRDIYGHVVGPVNRYGFKWAWSLCPGNQKLSDYYAHLFQYVSGNFEVDGFTVTHLRYSPVGHNIYNFFGCCCSNCAKIAGNLGYNFDRMKNGLMKMLNELHNLNAEKVKELGDADLSFTDWLYLFGPDASIIDWINFRCDLISLALKKFYTYAKEANNGIEFGADNFPPTFALLSGQRYRDFEDQADFLSPLLSHPFIFNILSFVETAKRLTEWNEKLREEAILPLLYRLFGHFHLGLPNSIGEIIQESIPAIDYPLPHIDVAGIYNLEAQKVRALTKGEKPIYGVISAHEKVSPEGVVKRAKAILENGMQGLIIQVSNIPRSKENLKALGEYLSSRS